jgi:hypothetical protein
MSKNTHRVTLARLKAGAPVRGIEVTKGEGGWKRYRVVSGKTGKVKRAGKKSAPDYDTEVSISPRTSVGVTDFVLTNFLLEPSTKKRSAK